MLSNPWFRIVIASGIAGVGFAVPTKYPDVRAACWTHSISLGVPALIEIISPPDTPPGLYPGPAGA